jgi:hypothetical protein
MTIDSTWKTLQTTGFSIQYPSDWEPDQSGRGGSNLILFSPVESPSDHFRENVNLIIQDLTGVKMDMDQYTTLSLKQIKDYFKDAVILENKRNPPGVPAQLKLVYTATQGGYGLQIEQYCSIIKEKAYILTLTTEQKSFTRYQRTGEAIMNSYMLKK